MVVGVAEWAVDKEIPLLFTSCKEFVGKGGGGGGGEEVVATIRQ